MIVVYSNINSSKIIFTSSFNVHFSLVDVSEQQKVIQSQNESFGNFEKRGEVSTSLIAGDPFRWGVELSKVLAKEVGFVVSYNLYMPLFAPKKSPVWKDTFI